MPSIRAWLPRLCVLGIETTLQKSVGLLLAWLLPGLEADNGWENELPTELAYRLGLAAYASRALSACSRLASQLLDQAG